MHEVPSTPPVADAPAALLDGGHLWLREHVTGSPLRFQLQPSGVLAFGDAEREFGQSVPLPYARAVAHVRERFDREALRASVDDPASVTFVGVAVDGSGVAYDWSRVPPFLGTEVRDADGGLRPPDAVEGIYDGLGLEPVNAVAKEVRAVDFDADGYEFPASAWYDGPAAGVVLADKTGHRAVLRNPAVGAAGAAPGVEAETAADLVERHATDRWLDGLVGRLGLSDDELGFDALFERAVAALARERAPAFRDGSVDVDESALRSAMADRVESYLIDRRG